jgi:hypothetical protein
MDEETAWIPRETHRAGHYLNAEPPPTTSEFIANITRMSSSDNRRHWARIGEKTALDFGWTGLNNTERCPKKLV